MKCKLFFLLLISTTISAQLPEIEFERLTTTDGLVSDEVLIINQDDQGYMWFGTTSGLSKFDGYSFTNFHSSTSDSSAVPDAIFTAIYKDTHGMFWLATYGNGLIHFDPTTTTAQRIRYTLIDSVSYFHNQVTSVVMDKEGTLWIGTVGGLYAYDPKTEQSTLYNHDPEHNSSLSSSSIRCLYIDKHNTLWVGTGSTWTWENNRGGLNRYDPLTKTFKRYSHQAGNKHTLMDNNILFMNEDNSGVLYVSTAQNMVHRYDRQLDRFEPLLEKNEQFLPWAPIGQPTDDFLSTATTVHQDRHGYYWIGSHGGGVNRFDLVNRSMKNHRQDSDNNYSLGLNNVWSIYEDNQGIIWLGTLGSGVCKVIPSRNRFYSFSDKHQAHRVLDGKQVHSFCTDASGTLWAGADNGDVYRFTDSSYTMLNLEKIFDFNGQGYYTIFQDIEHRIWIGGSGVGLICYYPDSNDLKRYIPDEANNTGLASWHVNSIAQASDGTLWLAHEYTGVDVFDPVSETFINHRYDPSNDKSFTNGAVRSVLRDSENNIWFGTQDGLYKYRKNTDDFDHFLTDVSIRTLYEDRQKRLWVGTRHSGLLLFDRTSGEIERFTVQNGLLNNQIYNIIQDDNGTIWIGSQAGLSRLEPDSKTFISFDKKDGVDNQFTVDADAVIKLENGELLFGGTKGVTAFMPDQITINTSPPNVVIRDVSVYKHSLQTDGKLDAILTLQHNQIDLTFEYVGLHFKSPDRNTYKVKLEPYDGDWLAVGKQRQTRYTSLKPGEYTFHVQAANSDGIWSEKNAAIQIKIKPPWWNTWLAYLMYSSLLFGLLWSTRRFELNRRREKENRRILQLENQRKTEELERARQLQLSMLPKQVPQLPNLDIAVYMNPATEVGGDYYDFHLSSDGTLTVAVGDATGHGLNAGMMVTATKSLFESLGGRLETVDFMNEANRTIKQMHLETLKMAFTILKIKGNRLYASGAGMPSLLIYRNATNDLQELNFEGMPLGSLSNFPYKEKQVDLSPGDKIILMSDGFPERQNPAGEMLEYPRAYQRILDGASSSPQELVEHLVTNSENWANGQPQDDDVTFVVIAIK